MSINRRIIAFPLRKYSFLVHIPVSCCRYYSDTSSALKKESDIDDPIRPSTYRPKVDLDSLLGDVHLSHSYSLSNDKYFAFPYKDTPTLKLKTRSRSRVVNPKLDSLISLIHKGKKESSWYLFKELHAEDKLILKQLHVDEVSGFLRLFSSGIIDARESWHKMMFLYKAAKDSGLILRASDYSELIKCAYKNLEFESVEELWLDAELNRVIPTTDLWNSYISAVCNTNVKYWPLWKYTKDSPETRKIPQLHLKPSLAYARQDIGSLIQRMHSQNVSLDSRTYELAMLYFAQIGDLGKCRRILEDLWRLRPFDENKKQVIIHPDTRPLRDDLLYPTISTLKTITDVFGYNDAATEGLYYVIAMIKNYHISVVGESRHQFWHNLLKWIFITTEPNRGKTPKEVFEKVWTLCTVDYQVRPDLKMYSWRIKHLKSSSRFSELANCIGSILKADQGTMKSGTALDLACQAYKRASVGLILQGKPEEAETLLNTWSSYDERFEKIREDVLNFKERYDQKHGDQPEKRIEAEVHDDSAEVAKTVAGSNITYIQESKVSTV